MRARENFAPPKSQKTGTGGNGAMAALADACKAQVWDAYPGVKTEDDFRLVISLCEDQEKLGRMVTALASWQASGRWAERRYVPKMRRWLSSGECWTSPPKIEPARAEGYSEAERLRRL